MSRRHPVRPHLVAISLTAALIAAFLGAAPASAAGGSITGKVTKPDGKVLANAEVDLYWVDGAGYGFMESVKTKSDGTYTFGSLRRGEYTVGFGADSAVYATEFWNNKTHIQASATISVGTSKVSSINAKLAVGGKVIGRVHSDDPNSSSTVVADAEVAAYRYDDGEWTYGKSTFTASDGRFTLGGLSDGQWTLEFNPPSEGPDADLALEYWEDSRVFDEDETFLVRPGMTVEDKEAHLGPGGRISGKVTGPDGEPVVNAFVFDFPGTSDEEVGNVAFTDENGNYVMTGLSAGQHRLEFVDALEFNLFGDGPKYAAEWWDDRESFAVAERITVTPGETAAGKDAQLVLAGTPLENTVQPSISGEARVGETLTASPGTWTPRISDATFQYQWFADGEEIAGADKKTFIPNSDHLGQQIAVRVMAERNNAEEVTFSWPTDPVAKGVLMPVTQPTILPSDPRVGQKLTIENGTWSKTVSSSRQILADGEPIEYDSSAGVPVEALGKRLSVRQTSNWAGYEPSVLTSAETSPVGVGQFDPLTTVDISGPAIVGEQLETNLLNEVSDATYEYQWLADGNEIPGASSETYTPMAADVGKPLTVHLTMSSPGRAPAVSTSDATNPVAERGVLPLTPGEVEIRGSARVGEELQTVAWAWAPSGVHLAYQWLMDGEPIPSATTERLLLTQAQGGKKITVKVTGSKSGFADTSVTSIETDPVVTSTPWGAPQNLESAASTMTTIDLKWTKVSGANKYRIYYGVGSGKRTKVEVGNVTSTTLKGLKHSTKYSIDIAAIRSDGTRSAYSPRIAVETWRLRPPFDFRVTATTSTTVTLTWGKVQGVPKYRIYHGIGSGTRTKTEVGDVDTTTITGLKPGTSYTIDIASLLADGTRSGYTPRITATTD